MFNVTCLVISDDRRFTASDPGCVSPSLKTFSITASSVLVVSRPQKADQSLTTMPPPIKSLPLFNVPAYNHIKTNDHIPKMTNITNNFC